MFGMATWLRGPTRDVGALGSRPRTHEWFVRRRMFRSRISCDLRAAARVRYRLHRCLRSGSRSGRVGGRAARHLRLRVARGGVGGDAARPLRGTGVTGGHFGRRVLRGDGRADGVESAAGRVARGIDRKRHDRRSCKTRTAGRGRTARQVANRLVTTRQPSTRRGRRGRRKGATRRARPRQKSPPRTNGRHVWTLGRVRVVRAAPGSFDSL